MDSRATPRSLGDLNLRWTMGNVIRTDALEAWKARQGGPESRREAPPTGLVAVERQQDVQACGAARFHEAIQADFAAQRVDGQEITLEPDEEPKAQVIDLMQALKSSLARKAGDRRPAKRSLRRTVRVESGASRKVAGKRPKSSGR